MPPTGSLLPCAAGLRCPVPLSCVPLSRTTWASLHSWPVPQSHRQDQQRTAKMLGGSPLPVLCVPSLMQVSRSQTRTLWPSGSPQAVGCWRHDWATHPQPPSPSRFPSLPGTASHHLTGTALRDPEPWPRALASSQSLLPTGAVSCTSPHWW